MHVISGAGASGTNWQLPSRRVVSWRDWGHFSAGVYERGAGEGTWRGAEHRLIHALTPPPPRLLLKLDGRQTTVPPPGASALAFYPAGVEVHTAGGSSRYAQLCWNPDLYQAIAPDLARAPDFAPEFCEDALVAQLIRSLVAEIGAGTLDRLLADSLVTAIAMRTLQRQSARPAIAGHPPDIAQPKLRRIVDYIEAHLGEELTLTELAEVACLNPSHLSRSFKAAVGVGPQRYVLQRRVDRAKALLRGSSMPLAAIAAELGFTDQSHFTNTFRRETGVTPGRFRAAVTG